MTIYLPHEGFIPVQRHPTESQEKVIYSEADFNIIGTVNVSEKSQFNIVPGTPQVFTLPASVSGDVVIDIGIVIPSPAQLQLFINQSGLDPELRFNIGPNVFNQIRLFSDLETFQGMTFDVLFGAAGVVYSYMAAMGPGRYYQKTKRTRS